MTRIYILPILLLDKEKDPEKKSDTEKSDESKEKIAEKKKKEEKDEGAMETDEKKGVH